MLVRVSRSQRCDKTRDRGMRLSHRLEDDLFLWCTRCSFPFRGIPCLLGNGPSLPFFLRLLDCACRRLDRKGNVWVRRWFVGTDVDRLQSRVVDFPKRRSRRRLPGFDLRPVAAARNRYLIASTNLRQSSIRHVEAFGEGHDGRRPNEVVQFLSCEGALHFWDSRRIWREVRHPNRNAAQSQARGHSYGPGRQHVSLLG